MSLRSAINEKPLVATIIAVVVIAFALGVVAWQMRSPAGSAGGVVQAAATVDDGLTWFSHDGSKTPPFDYKGQMAYGAMLYEADGKKFVGLMTRYTPDAKEAIEAGVAAQAEGVVSARIQGTANIAMESGMEIKKPGETKWKPWPTGQYNGRPLPAVVSASGAPALRVAP